MATLTRLEGLHNILGRTSTPSGSALPTTPQPPEQTKDLVLVGAGETAQIAYEYFTQDSPYNVVAFAVSRQYLEQEELLCLPVVPLEDLAETHPPARYEVHVACSYNKLNRVKMHLFAEIKRLGYTAANYVSSHAFVWHNVELGENCFIFENNVVQYHVRIGNNVMLWSGNHIGHRSVIGDHTYISSHVVVSGFCTIGRSCFLGVNATLGDRLTVGDDCVIGAGAVLTRDAESTKVYVGNPARPLAKSSFETFGVSEGT